MLTLFRLFLLFISCRTIQGQFPKSCSENLTKIDITCCPTPFGYENPCGYPERGICSSLSHASIDESIWPRGNHSYCQCFGNFFGSSCEDCIFGYSATDLCLTKSKFKLRSEIKEETLMKTLVLALNLSLITESPYVLKNDTTDQWENATWIDYFDYLYRFASDFALDGPAFLIWHRLFVLKLENVFASLLSDDNFSLSFWNWTSKIGVGAWCKMEDACSDMINVEKCDLVPTADDVEACLSLIIYDSDPLALLVQASNNRSFSRCVETLNERMLTCLNVTKETAFSLKPLPYLFHLSFIDKIFHEWMSRYRPSILAYPSITKASGQALFDNVQPFVPYVKHAVMFTDTAMLGYKYVDDQETALTPNSYLWLVGVLLCCISALLVLVLVISAQLKVGDGSAPKNEIVTRNDVTVQRL